MADSLFGIHAAAMRVHAQRMELIAGNLANADTPNYRARDLDFQKILSAADVGTASNPLQGEDSVIYRTADQPSLDGNTVSTQKEQAAFADASIRYQASMGFVESRLRGLLAAIGAE